MADYQQSKHPLVLRYHRLLEAFSKSDDERDFYLDRLEGALIFLDLDKEEESLQLAHEEIQKSPERFRLIPKLTYYETKKFMEGFVHDKVYDVDTKEKLIDIIGAKEAKENFLEFIYDHLSELDKWQPYYQERSRVRIIEWLIKESFQFVFEEDLELPVAQLEKAKEHLFDDKVSKDVAQSRAIIDAKAKSYYSSEALNPRPKRGRPPKQAVKVDAEPEFSQDIYLALPIALRQFLFTPDFTSQTIAFSSRFDTEEQLLASLKGTTKIKVDSKLEMLSQRLEALSHISGKLKGMNIDPATKRSISAELPESTGDLSSLISGMIAEPDATNSLERIKKQREKGVKQVTQIKYKNKKKSS